MSKMSAVVQLTKIFSTSVMHGFQIRGYREQNADVILQQEEEDAGTSVMTRAFKMLWRSIPPGRNYEGVRVQLKNILVFNNTRRVMCRRVFQT